MAYSDTQKAQACDLIRQNNGVIDEIMLDVLRDTLDLPKLPKMTAWRWWQHYKQMADTPTVEPDVTDKNNANVTGVTGIVTAFKLDEKLELAAHKFINHALRDELLMWTSSKDAITAAAIAIDKMRLLRDLPTEIVGITGEFYAAAQRHNFNPVEIMRNLINEIDSAEVEVNNG